MDWHSKSIRIGATVILCAIFLRLFAMGLPAGAFPRQALSMLLFLETGRTPGTVPTEETEQVPQTIPSVPEAPDTPQDAALAVFSADDAALVEINNICGYETDVAQGLTQALSWDLTAPAPTVLIIHSHGTESYENTEGYTPSGDYRTQDVGCNMISVGDRLVQVLEAGGIRAVHDRQLHDSPSYSDSYNNARESIARYLEQYPTIRLVLDIHRDAVENAEGQQLKCIVEGQDIAQLMLVVGTDASGLSHPRWPENMSLAVKLHAQLEKLLPGICRPISFRSQRFNQDLSPGALIVEVGAAGNTRQEALAAVELLGQAIISIAKGTSTE